MSNLDVRHPEDGLLLRYLDGELAGRKSRQVRSHLEACWQCRAQVEELETAIGECVRYRKSVLAPSLPPPPELWRSLDFGRVEAELAEQSLWHRMARFLSPLRHGGVRWALSGAAALALCFVAVQQLRETPKVQAAALLQKAVRAAQSRPAAHQRLRITTRTGQMTRVIGVAYKPPAREVEIARLFDAAKYDWNDPLSAQSFARWRGGLAHFQDAVASQANSYDIKTTTEDSELVSATLKLRTTDLEPMEGRFEFRNRDWVEMTELVDQQTNPASIVAGTTGGKPRQPGVPPGPMEVPKETADPAAFSEELQVVSALHRLGADLGDPLEISREAGQVLVSGTGIPPQRQQQIHGLLDRLPHVVVRFDDPAFPAGATPAPSEPATRDAAGPEKSTYAARIEERLGGRPQFERFSSSVLDWTDSAMTRAYALRRLAQQFPAAAENEMNAEDRRTLRRLGREHVAAFTKDAQRVANTVNPVLTGMVAGVAQLEVHGGATSWQAASEDLLATARRAETLLAVMLGVAPAENASGDAPAQLIIALAQLSRDAEECQRVLADR
jgi:predicted anti-sigma-YlaC factor YlaD